MSEEWVTLPKMQKSSMASKLWRGVLVVAQILDKGLRQGVCNGHGTFFWKDTWLESLVLQPLSLVESFQSVSAINLAFMVKIGWRFLTDIEVTFVF